MRIGVLALAGMLTLPAAAAAQTPAYAPPASESVLPYARFAVTPFVGYRLGYGTGDFFVFTDAGQQFRVVEERGGGPALGVAVDAQILRPLYFTGGVTYTAADQDVLIIRSPSDTGAGIRYRVDGPALWIAKAGLAYRLPDPTPDQRRYRPSAALTVAPAIVWMDWADPDGVDPEVSRTTRHFALNLGVDAATRIGSRGLALSLGVDDYITFWNRTRGLPRDAALYGTVFDEDVIIDYDQQFSNLLLLRLGLSYRF